MSQLEYNGQDKSKVRCIPANPMAQLSPAHNVIYRQPPHKKCISQLAEPEDEMLFQVGILLQGVFTIFREK